MRVRGDIGVQCGGARAGPACVQRYPGDDPDRWVSLTGSAYGEAFPDGEGRMRAEWYSTVLVGDVPDVGTVVMRYMDDPPSTVTIEAESGRSDDFFPARADQTLHYRMTVVDDAGGVLRELRADRPMRMSARIGSVPPLDARFVVQETITFSDVETGDPTVVLRQGSEGLVFEGGHLTVEASEPDAAALEEGRVDLSFHVAAPRREADSVWWSATAHGIALDEGEIVLRRGGAERSEALSVRGALEDAEAGTRMLVVHAFTTDASLDAVREAHYVRRF